MEESIMENEETQKEETQKEENQNEKTQNEEMKKEEMKNEEIKYKEIEYEEIGKGETDSNSCCPDGFLAAVRRMFTEKKQDIRSYSPLTLAYIGDAVYDLIIRTVVVEQANRPANNLHHITVKYVSANAQAKIVQTLTEQFTEEEQSVYRRGRNSKPHTMAKNAAAADYLKATGFEAVIGYLYLTDRMDRALELIREGIRLSGMTL